jgi:cob(I)alamin adenosyltransferase
MTKFYTKKGDDGYTGLLGAGRAPKYDPRIETVGEVDEANAAIALARTLSTTQEAASILLAVQKDLYHVMSEIAASPENAGRFRIINQEKVDWLEKQIELITSKVSIPDEFIVPGDSKAGAAIDLARTVVRRAERHIARLVISEELENREIQRYMNRLSSLCFILELYENQSSGASAPTLAKD